MKGQPPENACVAACAMHLRCTFAIHVCHLVAYNLRTYGFRVPVCHLRSRGLTLASCCVWPLQTDVCRLHKGDQTLDNVVLLGDVITCRKLSELMPRRSEHERTRE